MRTAIVHDWLNGMRGGEAVLEAIIDLFPGAELFTLIHERAAVSEKINSLRIHTSALQRLPGGISRYRHYLPTMPRLIEAFDLSSFDLVISSSHCVAKGVRKRPDAVHVSYVHAPMRYMWDRFDDYFGRGQASWPVRLAAHAVRGYLRRWDRRVSQIDRIDRLVANSRFIAAQISAAYGREADVVYPFADLDFFLARPRAPKDYYLIVSAFAPYKRIDLAIEAANRRGFALKIVGSGQEEARLRALAGPTVEFLGSVSREAIARFYSEAKAFLFPGVEDFGITPLEAMASGLPVIAYARGGALETVTAKTGVFFDQQAVEGLLHAIDRFERQTFYEVDCRSQAAQFSRARFSRDFRASVERALSAQG